MIISDLDRHYYGTHLLTLARHPSETEERLMIRLLAFAMFADEALEFGRGLSAEDEPALMLRQANGNIKLWIHVGLPEERLLRKAAGRAESVVLLAYGGRAVEPWWRKEGEGLTRSKKLTILVLNDAETQKLTSMCSRNMELQCTIQDSQLWFTDGVTSQAIELVKLI